MGPTIYLNNAILMTCALDACRDGNHGGALTAPTSHARSSTHAASANADIAHGDNEDIVVLDDFLSTEPRSGT